jgi:hypothetical protein
MSKGAGKIERAIRDLFIRSELWRDGDPGLDRSYTVTELCREIFGCNTPTRAQRVSALRAARSAMRRARKAQDRKNKLSEQAHEAAYAKHGQPPDRSYLSGKGFEHFKLVETFLNQHPAWLAAQRITETDTALVFWHATEMPDRTVVFHHYSRPARVWAVDITPAGIVWVEAAIEEITIYRVSVRYRGVRCPLDRGKLTWWGAMWRGVRFVSDRTGRTAALFERLRREWYSAQPDFQPEAMPLDEARRIIGLSEENYTHDDVIAAFRKAAKRCHPDLGGTAEMFRKLVEARDRLLASIGTSAPKPQEPDFTPSGYRTVYVSARTRARRIAGSGTLRLAG